MCVPELHFRRAFYSTKEKATVVLSGHFDFLCNDDCHVVGRAIITVLGDW